MAAALATLLGYLGGVSWHCDLLTHFRPHLAIGLSGVGLLALVLRMRWLAVAGLACATLNAYHLYPYFVGVGEPPENAGRSWRILVLNVNSRTGQVGQVRRVVEDANPEFVVLLEIDARWERELGWLRTSHPHHHIHPRTDNFGLGFFSRVPLLASEIIHPGDAGLPSILATVALDSGPLRVLASHPLPPIGRQRFRFRNQHLASLNSHVTTARFLLVGDLNTTPWSPHFRALLSDTGLQDSARGRGVTGTWPAGLPIGRLPIDHCLHSTDIVIFDRHVGAQVGSDHLPVIVDIGFLPAAPPDAMPSSHIGQIGR